MIKLRIMSKVVQFRSVFSDTERYEIISVDIASGRDITVEYQIKNNALPPRNVERIKNFKLLVENKAIFFPTTHNKSFVKECREYTNKIDI